MEDHEIVSLFWARREEAIPAAAEKYGQGCTALSLGILGSAEDAEECVSDAYLRAWEAIPPHRPEKLGAFLMKLTRNLSFSRWRQRRAEKRGGGEVALALSELGEIVSGGESAEEAVDRKALTEELEAFLRGIDSRKRALFLRRYWYAHSVKDIAADAGMSPAAVTMTLRRLREQLRSHLTERGYDL